MRKSPRASATAALLVTALLSTMAWAVTVQVLFRSGDLAADGARIGVIENPVATGPATVVFRGTTSAILVKNGATFSVIAKTGDPLPAPLAGTLRDFGDPVINDRGAVAFTARLSSATASRGIFLYEGGTLVPIAFAKLIVADVNAGSDVLLLKKNTDLLLWSRSSGTMATVVRRKGPAPGDATFRRIGARPVLSDAGVIAFEAQVRRNRREKGKSRQVTGIFTASLAVGPAVVAEGGEGSPIEGTFYAGFSNGTILSINGGGDVAFVGSSADVGGAVTDAVFLYRPAGPSTVAVARLGDPVGVDRLGSLSNVYVGVDSRGTVGFLGGVADGGLVLLLASGGGLTMPSPNHIGGNWFAPRLTEPGHLVWQSGDDVVRFDGAVTSVLAAADVTPIGVSVQAGRPSINDVDAVAFRVERGAIYRLSGDTARPIAAAGDIVPGAGPIRGFGVHAVGGGTVAFVARVSGGQPFIATVRDAGLAKVVASGDPTPLGGTFLLDDSSLGVSGSRALFTSAVTGGTSASGLFRANVATGAVDALLPAGGAAPGGRHFTSFGSVRVAGRDALFTATLDDQSNGVFLARGGDVLPIAITGERFPGKRKRTLATIGPVTANARRVLLEVEFQEEGKPPRLVLWQNRLIKSLAAGGGKAPGGGRFNGAFGPLALAGRASAFVADVEDGPAASGLFLARGGRVTELILDGAAASFGGTVEFSSGEDPLSLVGNAVVFVAYTVFGADARLGLVTVKP